MLTALEKYKPGVLRRVLGEEQEKALRYFAKDLEMLGDVGKEGASELKSKYDAQVRNDAEAQLLKGYRRLSVKRRQGLLAMID